MSRERKKSIVAVIFIAAMYLLAGYIEVHAEITDTVVYGPNGKIQQCTTICQGNICSTHCY